MANYQASEYQRMFAADADGEIRIILAGKTGEGKSALGNAILAKEEFVAKRSMRSETSVCSVGECIFDKRRLIAVDTPGLFDTDADPRHVALEIGKAISISAPGPHCFIITISARNRFTAEAQQTINLLGEIFGGSVLAYCIVVFTNEDAITDEGLTFEEWLPEQTEALPALADLIDSCGRRCMAFNSKSQSPDEIDDKVGQLLSMIDEMLAQNDGRVYTNDMYKKAERAARQREKEQLREAAEKDAKIQREMKKLRSKASMLQVEKDRLMAKEDRQKPEKHRRKPKEDRREAEEKERSPPPRPQSETTKPYGTILGGLLGLTPVIVCGTPSAFPLCPREPPFGERDETCTIS